MKACAIKAEPFTESDGPKARAPKPPEGAAGAFGAWRAPGIDGPGSIAPEMRGGIVHERSGAIRPCVNPLEGVGATGAGPRDATRRAYANDVERGRREPCQAKSGGLRPPFPE